MSRGRGIRIHAPAKINVTLRVLGVRADGYHELRTTFQSLALHDTLTFAPVPGPLQIVCSDPQCPTDRTNLVWSAAQAVWRAAGRRATPSGVAVQIVKRIPMQAGLGGGSANAAAALVALSALWRVPLDDRQMRAIARNIGADVAFFLEGGRVLGLERGDELYPLVDGPAAWVIIARPDFGVAGHAYRWWDAARSGNLEVVMRGNDLQAAVAAPPACSQTGQSVAAGRRVRCSHVGQRIGCVWPVPTGKDARPPRRSTTAAGDRTRTLTRRQHRA
jgi:4-diphosphocytidyl-2C-methyl-D-erythritol kinase